MNYPNVMPGIFRSRPNRFIAQVDIDGQQETVHVKNTGRCKELLVPGARVYLQDCQSPARKTRYDLIAVEKGDLLINMDSQAPNRVAAEYLPRRFPDLQLLRPETVYGNSRFDFYLETAREKWFVEVKGVTLEENGIARFPDAPTLRGAKHMEELIACQQDGYHAMALFILQMSGMRCFCPNDATDPKFSAALRHAAASGVELLAVDCNVTPDSLTVCNPVPILL